MTLIYPVVPTRNPQSTGLWGSLTRLQGVRECPRNCCSFAELLVKVSVKNWIYYTWSKHVWPKT